MLEEHDEKIGAEHGELALAEIHHAGGADQQHETERDQRIDRADAEAGEQQLQQDVHGRLRADRVSR